MDDFKTEDELDAERKKRRAGYRKQAAIAAGGLALMALAPSMAPMVAPMLAGATGRVSNTGQTGITEAPEGVTRGRP